MAAVEFIDVSKSFGSTAVVRGLNLSINGGEFVALLGPSGCGKTTSLRMLAGLERVSSGTLRTQNNVLDDGARTFIAPEKRRFGMVFQNYAIWPHMTVAENIAYPLRRQNVASSDIDRKVKTAGAWVRLEKYLDRRPHQLSGGQLQRVALARALIGNPSVLLMDEPLSNLDAALKEELRSEIATLRAKLETTILYVTHDQHEALALADRVAVMQGGLIEQIATPMELYEKPRTPFVANFVGGAEIFEGTISEGQLWINGVSMPMADALKQHSGTVRVALRAHDWDVTENEGPWELTAKLFMGSHFEYRFLLSDRSIRVHGPRLDVTVGQRLTLRARSAYFFDR